MARPILALVDDLIFASRIGVEVENGGGTLRRVGTTKALLEAIHNERPSLIIVDLDGMGFDGVAALEEMRKHAYADGIRRVAYGAHVDAPRLEAAQDAGAESMPRSGFVRLLPEIVRAAMGKE